jgi:hypothetical protein
MTLAKRKWHFDLPDGWTAEDRTDFTDLCTVRTAHGEYMTLDFSHRTFGTGMTGPVQKFRSLTKKTYKYAGWHQRLVNDAVDYAKREWGTPGWTS